MHFPSTCVCACVLFCIGAFMLCYFYLLFISLTHPSPRSRYQLRPLLRSCFSSPRCGLLLDCGLTVKVSVWSAIYVWIVCARVRDRCFPRGGLYFKCSLPFCISMGEISSPRGVHVRCRLVWTSVVTRRCLLWSACCELNYRVKYWKCIEKAHKKLASKECTSGAIKLWSCFWYNSVAGEGK